MASLSNNSSTQGYVSGVNPLIASGVMSPTGQGIQQVGGSVYNYGSSDSTSSSTGVNPGNVYNTENRQIDPWGANRGSASDLLGSKIGQTDPSDFYRNKLQEMSSGTFSPDDPSYQWRYDQGLQANERSLAAKGLLNSGNAAIELQNYGQNSASQEYGAQFSRILAAMGGTEDQYNTSMNRLMAMAGVGNANVGLGKQQLDQGALDNAGYQAGIAKSVKQNTPAPDPYAGYVFG